MHNESYQLRYYPADRYTGQKTESAFISTNATFTFDDQDRLVRGVHRSRFGEGLVQEIHKVDDGYSFSMDMGGGRVCWYRLFRRDHKLVGTSNPWNGMVTCPYYFKAQKTQGASDTPVGSYTLQVFNGDRDLDGPSNELLSVGWMELFTAAGDIGGWLALPFTRGGVCDFEDKGGDYFFRYTQCESNMWYRMRRTSDTEWTGDITGYPFHFAWPFHVEAERLEGKEEN